MVPFGMADGQTDQEAKNCGQQPAEVFIKQREDAAGKGDCRVEMQRRADGGGQGLDKIKDRGCPGKDHYGDVDGAVVLKALAEEGQKNEGDRGRIDQHEHGNGVFDDGAQADVGDREGEHRKQNGPSLIGNFAVGHLDERLGAGGDKADGGLETGEGDRDCEDDLADAAEIVTCDLREGDAAVFGGFKQAARLRTHQDGEDINDSHEDAGQHAGAEHVDGDRVVAVDTHAADDVDDDDAEGETGDGVHCAVTLNKRGEEGAGLCGIGRGGFDRRNGSAGMQQRCDDKDGEENEEDRVDDLADPDRDFAGAEPV